jgi:hypothetical protein
LKVTSDKLGLGLKAYGPETHIAAVIPMVVGVIAPFAGA